ncbi:MAG TPA: RsmE family RNA methyltransferase [Armatimonadota bacterium]|nr:RsmE family RNA methyltransferase [Armatimonadota bacterium]
MTKGTHLHRFFVRAECVAENHVLIDGPDARQIYCVLRLGKGDQISALDGTGRMLRLLITETSPSSVMGEIIESCPVESEPKVKLSVAQAMPKGDKLEFIIQKGTELGVSGFHILTTARTVPRGLSDKIDKRLMRWRTIAKEAAEQSCRAVIPEISGINSFEEFLPCVSNFDLAVCLWEDEKKTSFRDILRENRSAGSVLLFVGPEGGFEENEVRLMQQHGVLTASLGQRVLRCETAAIAAAAIVFYELES